MAETETVQAPERDVLDAERLREVLEAIPPGGWMSYGDVAAAAGGNAMHARTLNQRFIREAPANAHRVLKSDGTIAPTALGDPDQGAAKAAP